MPLGEGSGCTSEVNAELPIFFDLSSHSFAFGIGKLFSSIPSRSSKVLPIAASVLEVEEL